MFHVKDGLFFDRNDDGSVAIIKTTDGKEPNFPTPPDFPFEVVKGNILFSETLDAGSWASVVLSVTSFSERPGDWDAWMRHHLGKEDLLEGRRGGY